MSKPNSDELAVEAETLEAAYQEGVVKSLMPPSPSLTVSPPPPELHEPVPEVRKTLSLAEQLKVVDREIKAIEIEQVKRLQGINQLEDINQAGDIRREYANKLAELYDARSDLYERFKQKQRSARYPTTREAQPVRRASAPAALGTPTPEPNKVKQIARMFLKQLKTSKQPVPSLLSTPESTPALKSRRGSSIF